MEQQPDDQDRRELYRRILSDYQRSGVQWQASPLSISKRAIAWILQEAKDEGRRLTKEEALFDLHYWIMKGAVRSFRYYATRWDWSERQARDLFASLGLVKDDRKGGKKVAGSPDPATSPAPRKSGHGLGTVWARSGHGLGTIPHVTSLKSSILGTVWAQLGHGLGTTWAPLCTIGDNKRDSKKKREARAAAPADPKATKKGKAAAKKEAPGDPELGGILQEEIPAELRVQVDPDEPGRTFLDAWREWCYFRRHERKEAVTRTAALRMMKLLLRHSDPIAMIDQSLRNQWRGIFPVKRDTDGTRTKGNSSRPSSEGGGSDFSRRRDFSSREFDPEAWGRLGDSLRSIDDQDGGALPSV